MSGAWLFTLIPAAAAILGAALAIWRPPGPAVVAAVQHFAAGVVFAAAASEILPDLKHQSAAWSVLLGGGLGVGAMLLVRYYGERASGSAQLQRRDQGSAGDGDVSAGRDGDGGLAAARDLHEPAASLATCGAR